MSKYVTIIVEMMVVGALVVTGFVCGFIKCSIVCIVWFVFLIGAIMAVFKTAFGEPKAEDKLLILEYGAGAKNTDVFKLPSGQQAILIKLDAGDGSLTKTEAQSEEDKNG